MIEQSSPGKARDILVACCKRKEGKGIWSIARELMRPYSTVRGWLVRVCHPFRHVPHAEGNLHIPVVFGKARRDKIKIQAHFIPIVAYPLLANQVVLVVFSHVGQGAEEHDLVRACHSAPFEKRVEHADVAGIGIRRMSAFGHADGMLVVLICCNGIQGISCTKSSSPPVQGSKKTGKQNQPNT